MMMLSGGMTPAISGAYGGTLTFIVHEIVDNVPRAILHGVFHQLGRYFDSVIVFDLLALVARLGGASFYQALDNIESLLGYRNLDGQSVIRRWTGAVR